VAPPREVLTVAGREVAISNPDKLFFPALGICKRDLVRYYLAVADGAVDTDSETADVADSATAADTGDGRPPRAGQAPGRCRVERRRACQL